MMNYLVAQVVDMKLLRFKLWLEVAVQVEVQIRVSGEKMNSLISKLYCRGKLLTVCAAGTSA